MRRLSALIIALGVSCGGLWAVAQAVRSPAQELADRRPPPARSITEALAPGPLMTRVRLDCYRVPTLEQPVPRVAQPDAFVTAVPLAAGQAAMPGRPVLELNGRPVIALATDYPFYRQLGPGDRGRDVAALAAALGVAAATPDATFDDPLQAALHKLYADAGYEAPRTSGFGVLGPEVFLPAEVVSVSGDMVAARAPQLGAPATSGAVLLRSRSSQLRCDLPEAVQIDVGTTGVADGEPAHVEAIVAADIDTSTVGEADENTATTTALSVALVRVDGNSPAAGTASTGTFEFDRPVGDEDDVVAPSTAVYEDTDGTTFVLVSDSAGKTRRITVEVMSVERGFVLLRSSSEVRSGRSVVVGATGR